MVYRKTCRYRAVLLAGGRGTRLYPYTAVFPKPLVPVGDKPILEILIRQLKYYGFREITLCVGHLANLIETYFGDGSRFGVKLDYSFEDKPMGTIAPLNLLGDLPNTFLVANGDLLIDFDFRKIWKAHRSNGAILTIGTCIRHEKVELGVLEAKEKMVVSYKEKPEFDYRVSTGVYIFSKRVLEYVPKKTYFDFPCLVNKLLENKEKVMSYDISGFWLDIGRPDDYQKAVEKFSRDGDIFKKFFR